MSCPLPPLRRPDDHHRGFRARQRTDISAHFSSDADQDRHVMIARIACHKATRRARRQRGDSARQVDALGVERAAGANRQRRRQPISSDSTLPNGNSRPIYPRAGYTGLLPVYFFSAAALSFSYSDVAPVWWTPQYYRRRCPQCREHVEHMRQNSDAKWSSWSEPDERLESWLGSLSRPLSRSATGLPRRTVMKAAVRTA